MEGVQIGDSKVKLKGSLYGLQITHSQGKLGMNQASKELRGERWNMENEEMERTKGRIAYDDEERGMILELEEERKKKRADEVVCEKLHNERRRRG
ncbi:hypothetical protein WR25_17515 [Diploscapter pachys]|uniref:Uncharacterized protein n=1 Tax=Diploscapter pachys TaxID=2018661 RepID=A0A2A2L6J2_9BILA|nr:hypothetical protein WR25_17515 [Diploscapter pachys]